MIKYIFCFQESWEKGPLQKIVKDNQLTAYKHEDFWQPMDTLREKHFCQIYGIVIKRYENQNITKNIIEFKKSVTHNV